MITKQQRAEIAELLERGAYRIGLLGTCVLTGLSDNEKSVKYEMEQAATILRSEPKIQARWEQLASGAWFAWRSLAYVGTDGRASFDGSMLNDSEPYPSIAQAKQACEIHAQRLLAQLTRKGEA